MRTEVFEEEEEKERQEWIVASRQLLSPTIGPNLKPASVVVCLKANINT